MRPGGDEPRTSAYPRYSPAPSREYSATSHFGSELWNTDLLGDDYLAPASSVLVNIDDGAGCRFDFKTVFDDGTTQIRRNVDVCAVERYAISYR